MSFKPCGHISFFLPLRQRHQLCLQSANCNCACYSTFRRRKRNLILFNLEKSHNNGFCMLLMNVSSSKSNQIWFVNVMGFYQLLAVTFEQVFRPMSPQEEIQAEQYPKHVSRNGKIECRLRSLFTIQKVFNQNVILKKTSTGNK